MQPLTIYHTLYTQSQSSHVHWSVVQLICSKHMTKNDLQWKINKYSDTYLKYYFCFSAEFKWKSRRLLIPQEIYSKWSHIVFALNIIFYYVCYVRFSWRCTIGLGIFGRGNDSNYNMFLVATKCQEWNFLISSEKTSSHVM